MPKQESESLTPVAASGVEAAVEDVVATAPAALHPKLSKAKGANEIAGTGVPAIAFCNSKSGGGKGAKIFERFKNWLGEDQVYDLGHNFKPTELLEKFRSVQELRVIVCGGPRPPPPSRPRPPMVRGGP